MRTGPVETYKSHHLPTPKGRSVSLAAIMVAWCAAHPGEDFPATKPFTTAASDVRALFPYSWGELFVRAEAAKDSDTYHTHTPRHQACRACGDKLRAELIELGVWHEVEFGG